jgi:hypothetical protein
MDEYESAWDSMGANREFDSNEIEKSDLHPATQNDPMISISQVLPDVTRLKC